jgi:hypothetical protein
MTRSRSRTLAISINGMVTITRTVINDEKWYFIEKDTIDATMTTSLWNQAKPSLVFGDVDHHDHYHYHCRRRRRRRP